MAKSLDGIHGNRIGGPCKLVVKSSTDNKRDKSPKPYEAYGGSGFIRQSFKRYDEWEDANAEFDVLNDTPTGNGYSVVPDNIRNTVHNRALNKVKGQIAPIQSFFEDWYEREQAYSMLYSAGKEIFRFVRDIKNPRKLARRLKTSISKVNKKTIPQRWLEYNFGIKPLVGTVQNAIDLLNRDFPIQWFEATSGHFGDFDLKGAETGWQGSYDYFVKMGVQVVGYNPNRILAASLGLDKPLTNAWSVTPWGWAVDYFVNVSEYLSNYEPFATGVEIGNSYTTTFERSHGSYYTWYPGEIRASGVAQGFHVERSVPASLTYELVFADPRMISNLSLANKVANLFSAISLSMKG